jgi:hypothetical protein
VAISDDAANLVAGYRLLNDDASWAEVVSVSMVDEPLLAYNLTVEGFHTYFVAADAQAVPVWVHNTCFDFAEFIPIHSRETILSSNKVSYDFWSNQSPQTIIDDLLNGAEKIVVGADGRVWNGNTRLLALQDMGYDVNQLIGQLTRDYLK